MTLNHYGHAVSMDPIKRRELAQPVIDALRAIPNVFERTDANGIPYRGTDLYRRALDRRFTMEQLAAARVQLGCTAPWPLLDELEVARAIATELGRSPDEAGTARLAADLAK